jgi:hypothetical protein
LFSQGSHRPVQEPAWYFLPESENSSCLESALDSQGVLLAMT